MLLSQRTKLLLDGRIELIIFIHSHHMKNYDSSLIILHKLIEAVSNLNSYSNQKPFYR